MAVDEWYRLASILVDLEWLTELDLMFLAMYCQAFADIVRLTREVRLEGEVCVGSGGRTGRNPKCLLLKQAQDTVIKLGARLGLSPFDRVGTSGLK